MDGRQPLFEGGSDGGGDLLLLGFAAREIEEGAQGSGHSPGAVVEDVLGE